MLYKNWILFYRFFSKVNYVIEFDTTSSVYYCNLARDLGVANC